MLFRTTPGGGLRNISASIQTSKGGDPGPMGALVGRIPRGPGRRMGDVVVTGGGTLLPPTQPTGFALPRNAFAAKAINVAVAPVALRAQSVAAQASAAAAVVGPAMQKAVIHGSLGPSSAPSGPVMSPTNDPSQSPTPTATYLNQQAAQSAAASGNGPSASAPSAAIPLSPAQLGFSTSDTTDSSVSPQDPGSTTAGAASGASTAAAPIVSAPATPAASSPSTGLYVGVGAAALAAGIGLYLAVR